MLLLAMQFIDCHCHLPAAAISDLPRIINTTGSLEWGGGLSENAEMVSVYLGMHPWFSADMSQIESLEKRLMESSAVGIGEVGLDYGPRGVDISIQKKIFSECCQLALHYSRPLSLHIYKAWQDLWAIAGTLPNQVPAMIHGFTGSPELAEQLIRKGYFLSLGPAILSREITWLQDLLKKCPPHRILVESDYDGSPLLDSEAYENLIIRIYNKLAEASAEMPDDWRERIVQNSSVFTN